MFFATGNMKNLFGVLILLFCAWRLSQRPSTSISASLSEIGHRCRSSSPIGNQNRKRAHHASSARLRRHGLSINFAGTSSRTQILNFQASSITTFTYIVTPTKEGVFEIPSIEVSAGGKDYRTSSLVLKVIHENSNSADQQPNADKPYFAELVVPKESAYVGEQIPIELRFYFNQRMQYQPYPQGQYPLIDGEGFVTKKYRGTDRKTI